MSNNNNLRKITTQDSVPAAATGTGTVSSANNGMIIGVGTSFTTEAEINDWFYIKAQNEFRRILKVASDTEIYIDGTFTVPLAAEAFHITPDSKFVEISWLVNGVADAKIDGVTVSTNTTNDFTKAGKGPSGGAGNKYIDPIDVDATGTEVTITTLA